MFFKILKFYILLIYLNEFYDIIYGEGINNVDVSRKLDDDIKNSNNESIVVLFSMYLTKIPDNKLKMVIEEIENLIEEIVKNHGMGISYFGDILTTSQINEEKLVIKYQTTEGSDMCNEFKNVIKEIVDDHYAIKSGNVIC